MLTNLIYFALFKCVERFVHLSTHLQPGIFFSGGFSARHISERDACELFLSHISIRMPVDSLGRQITQLLSSAVVFRASREEKRPQCENLRSLLSTCRWQAKSTMTLSPVRKEPNNCGCHLPRARGRHPSTVGDLESQLLDYD